MPEKNLFHPTNQRFVVRRTDIRPLPHLG